jgi:molybdopterin-synthase adenylyltransferase
MPGSDDSLPVRPRIKPIYDVLYLEGRIRLGSGAAFSSEIEDETGRYAQLVRLLDGEHTVAQLTGSLSAIFEPGEVTDGLQVLLESGFLEDAATQPPPELSADDVERYKPNLNFFRAIAAPGVSCFDAQVLLKQTRVTIFGLGGIGSNVAMSLAELGVGHISAIDFDRVELSNLNRQVLYSTTLVGTPKAVAAAQRMKEFNPDIEFVAEERKLTSLADAQDVVDSTAPDFLFCLADRPNGYIDFWTNQACVRRGIPYTAASISCAVGTAYSVLPGAGPCYQCRVDQEAAGEPQLTEALDYIRKHQVNASNGALGAACMMMACFLSYELLRWRTGMTPMLAADRLLEVDFMTFEQRWHDFSRRDDCRVCGGYSKVP